MIERKLLAPYIDQSLEILRKLTLAANSPKSVSVRDLEIDFGLQFSFVRDQITLKLLPGIINCPATGEIRSQSLTITKEAAQNYAYIPYVAWHLYAKAYPQPEKISLSNEMSPFAKRLQNHLGLNRDEIAESVLTGRALQKEKHFLQFSQRMHQIIVLSYINGPLTINKEAHCIIGTRIAETALDGIPMLRGKPIQRLIDAPFMADSTGKIIHARGTEKEIIAVYEENPVEADLWNGKRETKSAQATKIWDHVEETIEMIEKL